MSTKNTQNTEDMLDQTFANFDSQVTGIEEEVSNKKPVAATGGKSNMMLFIAAGIAAVGAIAYIVVIKGGMLDGGQPAPVQPQAQVAPANPGQPATPTVDTNAPQLPGATPTVPPVDASNPAVPGLPQAPQLPGAPAIPVPPVVDATAPVVPPTPPVDASVPTAPVIPEVKVEAPQVAPTIPKAPEVKVEVPAVTAPVANTSVPSLPAVKIDNLKAIGVKPSAGVGSESSASIMLAEELKSMFERQTSEFKTELTDVSTRVGAIESAVTEQKDINKKVEERLVKLENGAVVPAGKSKLEAIKIKSAKQAEEKKAEESASKEEEEKPVVKQKYSKKKEVAVAKKVKPTTTKKEVKPTSVKEEAKEAKDDSLLIDKSEPSAPVSVKKSKEKEVVKVNMPKIEVHSIYGGRAWVKNADGSLATYEVGDTLPTGEKIKKVNDDAFEIVTDKRTISK
jgi:hypothetical protein